MSTLAFLNQLGPMEIIALLMLGLILFGRRLPEVGRNMGRGIVEFKRGLKGIADEVEEESSKPAQRTQSSLPPKDAPIDASAAPQPPHEEVRVSRSEKVD
jgi:sec-independent protein translocase protein TatA